MNIRYIVLLISFFPGNLNVLNAQDSARLNGQYFKNILSDAGYIFSGPGRWNGKEWAKAAAISGGAVALYLLADQEVADFSQRSKSSSLDFIAHGVEPYGNGRFAIGYPVLTYAAGALFKNQRAKRTGLLMFESYILTGVTYQTSLYIFSRNRPDTGRNAFDTFQGPRLNPKQSFMSGHTAIAFCLSTTIALEFRDTKWVPPVMYSLAALTSLSRIYDNRHWITDVFIGGVTGHLIAKSVMRRQWARDGKDVSPRLSLFPMVSPYGKGISMTFQLSQ